MLRTNTNNHHLRHSYNALRPLHCFLVVVALAPYNTSAMLIYAILHGNGQCLDSLVSGKIEVTQRQWYLSCMQYFLSEHTRDYRQYCVFCRLSKAIHPFSEMVLFLKVANWYDFTAVASLAKCVGYPRCIPIVADSSILLFCK